jgi:hypothetical protein
VSIGITPNAVVLLFVLVFGITRLLRGPVGTALGDRIRGTSREPDAALAAEVDEVRMRLAEVEERLDFAERLLAQTTQAERLPEGTHT